MIPRNTSELVTLLALEAIEETLYRGQHPETAMQRAFGGQVLAQALVAAQRTVPDDRAIHSLHAYFMRPGRTDVPIIYDVDLTRDGNTFSSRQVMARQGGSTIFMMGSSFHVLEDGLSHRDAPPRDVPDPDTCPSLADVLGRRLGDGAAALFREMTPLDVRYAGDSGRGGQIPALAHGAHMRVWVRTSDPLPDDPTLHQAALAYLSDFTLLSVSTVPHEVAFLSPQMQAASIDHAMWFHRPFRADQWLLYDQVSPSASHALGLSNGRLFQDGELVASCAQEGLIRVVS